MLWSAGLGAATRTLVSVQSASYQWAQYLGKVMTALAWSRIAATHGPRLRVSANTAAITQTRSLDHPVFAAAFGGAGACGVQIFTAQQSQQINGLLAVHDWFAAAPPARFQQPQTLRLLASQGSRSVRRWSTQERYPLAQADSLHSGPPPRPRPSCTVPACRASARY